MKRFLYLFQVEQDLPAALQAVEGPDSDVIFLSWRERSADPRSIHYPSSSWTQGRNRLFREALGRDYQYFVFADDDLLLELTPLGARDAPPRANPWRVFEDFLLKYEPAVGCTAHLWHLTGGALDPTQECQTIRFFDALLNAFHREALSTLLPYYDLLDADSECYAQNLLCSLATDLYPGHVLQTNRVTVKNLEARRTYTELLLSGPEHLYLDALRNPEDAARFRRQTIGQAARHPTVGTVRAKTGSYEIPDAVLSRRFRLEHPFFARRREILDLPVTDDFFSADPDSARARAWRSVRGQQPPVPLASGPPAPLWHRMLQRTRPVRERIGMVRANPLLQPALEVLAALRSGRRYPNAPGAVWRRWWREPGSFLQIPELRQMDVFRLLSAALNRLQYREVVFIDVGAARGHVLHHLQSSGLQKGIHAIGIDALDARAHGQYAGYVLGAVTEAAEGNIDLFRYSSADCSSLKLMNASAITHDAGEGGQRYYTPSVVERLEERLTVPAFRLSTIIRQFGLAEDVLHFVKIDAQGSDLGVFRSLDELQSNVLFLQIETVYGENGEGGPTLYQGQSTFPEDRAVIEAAGFRLFNVARFGVTPEADAVFVNTRLFARLLPRLAR